MFAAVNPPATQTKMKLIEFNDQHEILFFRWFISRLARFRFLFFPLPPSRPSLNISLANKFYLWENYRAGKSFLVERAAQ